MMIRTVFLAASATLLLVSAANAENPSFVTDATVNICTTAAFPPLTFKKDPADTVPTRSSARVI